MCFRVVPLCAFDMQHIKKEVVAAEQIFDGKLKAMKQVAGKLKLELAQFCS
jgi:hypothetical protein